MNINQVISALNEKVKDGLLVAFIVTIGHPDIALQLKNSILTSRSFPRNIERAFGSKSTARDLPDVGPSSPFIKALCGHAPWGGKYVKNGKSNNGRMKGLQTKIKLTSEGEPVDIYILMFLGSDHKAAKMLMSFTIPLFEKFHKDDVRRLVVAHGPIFVKLSTNSTGARKVEALRTQASRMYSSLTDCPAIPSLLSIGPPDNGRGSRIDIAFKPLSVLLETTKLGPSESREVTGRIHVMSCSQVCGNSPIGVPLIHTSVDASLLDDVKIVHRAGLKLSSDEMNDRPTFDPPIPVKQNGIIRIGSIASHAYIGLHPRDEVLKGDGAVFGHLVPFGFEMDPEQTMYYVKPRCSSIAPFSPSKEKVEQFASDLHRLTGKDFSYVHEALSNDEFEKIPELPWGMHGASFPQVNTQALHEASHVFASYLDATRDIEGKDGPQFGWVFSSIAKDGSVIMVIPPSDIREDRPMLLGKGHKFYGGVIKIVPTESNYAIITFLKETGGMQLVPDECRPSKRVEDITACVASIIILHKMIEIKLEDCKTPFSEDEVNAASIIHKAINFYTLPGDLTSYSKCYNALVSDTMHLARRVSINFGSAWERLHSKREADLHALLASLE